MRLIVFDVGCAINRTDAFAREMLFLMPKLSQSAGKEICFVISGADSAERRPPQRKRAAVILVDHN
jgi:hypothetical protein